MSHDVSFEEFWESAPAGEGVFDPSRIAAYPGPARRYLEHAIAPGTPLARSVRLRMQGEIRLKEWAPFTADQVIRWDRGMIWRARTRVHGLPVSGFDRLVDGEGEMRWKLLGIVPVLTAAGPDITRSAAGRVEGESVWLPSVLLGEDVSWAAPDASQARARLEVAGVRTELALALWESGGLENVHFQRWGNPEGAEFHAVEFGGFVEEERTFGGYTIPTQMRLGWHFGTDRFAAEGEFIRITIDEAVYR